jgi:phage terminase large subunit-like protein
MGLRGPNSRPKKRPAKSAINKAERRLTKRGPKPRRSDLVMKFLEQLPVTKGHLVGQKMKLLPAQVEFIEAVYGRLDVDGRRQIRLAVQSEPRGNGKSGLLAGLSLCHLCGPEAVKRGAVFSAAVDRQQASLLFNEMSAIIHASKNSTHKSISSNIGRSWK